MFILLGAAKHVEEMGALTSWSRKYTVPFILIPFIIPSFFLEGEVGVVYKECIQHTVTLG